MQQQLPGGLFYEPSPELTSETLSVLPHNKIPERAFGVLDFMVRYRPNASILTNESFFTFSFNQTNEWLDSLSEKERNELLQDARKKGRELRGKFKGRCEEIERKRLNALKEKQEAIKKKKENTFKKRKNKHLIICEKRKALVSQLRFRQNVLKQYVKDKKIFNASNNGRLLTIETLTENVKQLIEEAASKDVASSIHQRSSKMPILVNKRIRHSFNEGAFDGKVISTVPGFPDYYNIIYDCELNAESNVTDSTAIYTYRLLEDYREGKLEIIPEVVGVKPCSEFSSRLLSLAHAAQIASHCFTFSFSDK
ncbi:unnamed protein product [Mytilus coruscus]|uniref:Uncharacterized protein n=1 Tax=Mytilus coruscus TaxID=42192 RepID=A0A6J8BYP0_MYTCO|nr:unnamed protein product [Mytilus coruscus]